VSVAARARIKVIEASTDVRSRTGSVSRLADGLRSRIYSAAMSGRGAASVRRSLGLLPRLVSSPVSWIVAVAVAFFLAVTVAGLSDPGLQYDELLFVNAALGGSHAYHDFIYSEALGVPTMLMPYIGALKAWLYAPVFSVFGVSVDSVRLPAVLLAALAILGAVLLVRRLLGSWPAAVAAVLLTTDPVFGAVARADWGPIVLSALLRVAALLAYFAFVRRGSVRYLWLLVAALTLGLFNKLDYVWFIAALTAAACVVHHRELVGLLRRRPIPVLLPVMVMGAVLVAALFDLILPATRLPLGGSRASLSGRISEVGHLFRITVDGTGVYQYMTGSPLAHGTLIGSLFAYVFVGCALVAVWSVVWGRRRPAGDPLAAAASATSFFVVVFAVLAVGIVLTRQATGPQHIMLLWPLPAILTVCLAVTLVRLPVRAVARLATAFSAIVLAGLVFTQIRATASYVHADRSSRTWNPIWSAEIYSAVKAVSRSAHAADLIVAADWGLGTQIYALGGEAVRGRFADEWPAFDNPVVPTSALEQAFFVHRRVIVVFHTVTGQIMPGTTARVQTVIAAMGGHAKPIYMGRQIEAELVVD
jgi:4-amino-4-deoxy-L-arabinose transferase-like glycosyltransferase